ncbi:GGDEF domain-containing protein [Pseudoalteromonas sp. SSDWG2]|uniref:GGDEF domain-containing protein n=1 Tax=Pseudoalteromonas sp. SSDWG2 TaxID=3139391 RepID=UPI003BAC2928
MQTNKNNPPVKLGHFKDLAYALLLLMSFILVIWQYVGMETTLTIDTDKEAAIAVESDRANDGISQAKFNIINDAVAFECQTKNTTYTFAYCGVRIDIAERDKGIDLTHYDSISFDVDYQASEKDTLFVYLINAEGETQERANMHALFPKEGTQRPVLQLHDFVIPSWWFYAQNDPNEHGVRRLDNVIAIKIVSGDSTIERKIDFAVSNIILKGKWIKADLLYLSLLLFWLVMISYNVIKNVHHTRMAYNKALSESKQLKELNSFLELEKSKFATLAQTDPLTQIANRAGVRDFIHQQMVLYTLKQQPCAIILLDVDHFKSINDNFGHNEGDDVLKVLAALLQSHVRKEDKVARWGGEEFLIVCPHTNKDGALLMAQALRKRIETASISQHTTITCSFGVSEFDSTHFEHTFQKADEALYEAKNAGRNCVKVASAT